MVRKCIHVTSHLLSCIPLPIFYFKSEIYEDIVRKCTILCTIFAHVPITILFILPLFICNFFQASKMWIQNKVDESKHDIHSQVDAITAGTASVVNLTSGKALTLLKIIKLVKCKIKSFKFHLKYSDLTEFCCSISQGTRQTRIIQR